MDIDARKPIKIDKDRYLFPPGQRVPVWSPDSKWIAYSKRLPNYLSTIFVHSLAEGRSHQLTDGLSDARYPVFDKEGKYLYFTASTDSGPSLEPDLRSATRAAFPQPLHRGALEGRPVALLPRERRGAPRQAGRREEAGRGREDSGGRRRGAAQNPQPRG